MSATHRRYANVRMGRKTCAYLSIARPKTLIVFVHGFGGSSAGTWAQFPQLLPEQYKCRESDVIFFGYRSVRNTLGSNADLLGDFIKEWCTAPGSLVDRQILRELGRPLATHYGRIIIVAHSIGAIVSRLALLTGLRKNQPWASVAELFFFAPAHEGARTPAVILEMLATIECGFGFAQIKVGTLIGQGFTYFSPVLDDVLKKTKLLERLKADTIAALHRGRNNVAARKTIFGGQERVVWSSVDFIAEEPRETSGYYDCDHSSVCKPRSVDFERPLEDLLSIL